MPPTAPEAEAPVSKDLVCNTAWRACDTFRGVVDPAQYKDYVLVTLFLKYISDLWSDHYEQYRRKYGDDPVRIERVMQRERFVIPPQCHFNYLYEHRHADDIGTRINHALEEIEENNKAKLDGVFRNIDFNSEANLGKTRDRNRRLASLLDDFADPKLDLSPSRVGNRDLIGDVYEFLIECFASDAGKKGGEFYTPPEPSELLARLLKPEPGARIVDPACGSGSLLIRVGTYVSEHHQTADGKPSKDFALFGQESNGSTWALCRMNMFLHEMDQARIEWCDTITSPMLIEDAPGSGAGSSGAGGGQRLMKFDIVVANPPFSLDKWGHETAETEKKKLNRFHRGVPPKSRGDYAFISHMIESMNAHGRMAVIVPHGVLFRGGAEGRIRKQLIEENLLEAAIGLPANLFHGTGIPVAVLVFNKQKTTRDILFIDASRDYEDAKKKNKLRPQDIDRIVQAYEAFETVEKYAYRAKVAEVEENEFNLNIPRYVDTFEDESRSTSRRCRRRSRNWKVSWRRCGRRWIKFLGS